MSNIVKLGTHKTPTQGNGSISTGCIALYPCHQATTDNTLTDTSGNGYTAQAGAALVPATAFASPQGITTTEAASTDTTCYLPLAQYNYSYNANESLLWHTRVKLTAIPAATKPLVAQGGNNASAPGLRLIVTNTGLVAWALDHAGGTAFSANTDIAGPANDGKLDTNWRSVMLAMWALDKSAGTASYGIWIDGTYAFNATGAKSATGLPASVTPAEGVRIGQYYRSSGPTTASIGGLHSYAHLYRAPSAVTHTWAQMDALAKRLAKFPGLPLNSVEWPMT